MNNLKWIIWAEIGGLLLAYGIYTELYLNNQILWKVAGISLIFFILLVFINNEKENNKSNSLKKRKKKI